MKRVFFTLFAIFIVANVMAQAPQSVSYQAIVRNSAGGLVQEQEIEIELNILQGSISGNSVYTESHTVTSNVSGLITLAIGTGSSSDDFGLIDWPSGPMFLNFRIKEYGIDNTNQFLSVPYAIYAARAGSLHWSNLTGIPWWIADGDDVRTEDEIMAIAYHFGFVPRKEIDALEERIKVLEKLLNVTPPAKKSRSEERKAKAAWKRIKKQSKLNQTRREK